MRFVFYCLLAAIAAWLLIAAPQPGLAKTTCALGQTLRDGGVNYPQCPPSIESGDIGVLYNSARLQPDVVFDQTPIWLNDGTPLTALTVNNGVNDLCRFVDATPSLAHNAAMPLLIPFNRFSEWLAFYKNIPKAASTAGCCVPRAMQVRDVPLPAMPCASWVLQGLIDNPGTNTLIAVPSSDTIQLIRTDGVAEEADYPINAMPFVRDDAGVVEPVATRVYYARWLCPYGRQPVGESQLGRQGGRVQAGNREAMKPVLVMPVDKDGVLGTRADVAFRLQCRNADWQPITPTTCVDSKSLIQQTCQQAGYASTYRGKVLALVRQACQANGSKIATATTAFDNCAAPPPPQCTPTDSTSTQACPRGYTGTAVLHTQHLCDGSNNGAGRDSSGLDASSCTPLCTAADTRTTQPCAAGYQGSQTMRTQRLCDGSHDGLGSMVITTDSHSCTRLCTAVDTRIRQPCANGYRGSQEIHTQRICDGSNHGAGQVRSTIDSHACIPLCVETRPTRYRQACPAGYHGSILLTRRHHCDGSNHGAGRDIIRRVSSRCNIHPVGGAVPGSDSGSIGIGTAE